MSSATLQLERLNAKLRAGGLPTQTREKFVANWYAKELKHFQLLELSKLRSNCMISMIECGGCKKHIAMCKNVIKRIEKLLIDGALEGYGTKGKAKRS